MVETLEAKVAIVGAGPTGSSAALELLRRGIDDVVLVDLRDFPRDKTCGSGLSPRAIRLLRELDVWDAIEPIAYPIDGIRLVSGRGNEVYSSAGEVAARILLRREFDHVLLQTARARGASFVPGFAAREPLLDGDRWVGFRARDGREVHAQHVILAGGAHSTLGPRSDRKRALQTVMGWWEGVDFRPNTVEMIWDDPIAPCYGWLFPETETRVNIGITYDDDGKEKKARDVFQQFLDRQYAGRLAGAKQLGRWKGFPIVYTYRTGPLAGPGYFAAGEAGRLTHPATGEGISQGMLSARYAAEAIAEIDAGRRSEAGAARRYERRCAASFAPSFLLGGAFRGALRAPVMDWVVRASALPVIQRTATRFLAHF